VLFPAPMPLEESCPEGSAARLKDEQRPLRELICKEHDKIARGLSLREFLADLWNYQPDVPFAAHRLSKRKSFFKNVLRVSEAASFWWLLSLRGCG